MFKRLQELINDPFGRRKIQETHDPILDEIRMEAKRVREQRERVFPISATVSNSRLRKEINRHAH